jgi:hypothetical protein
MTFETVQQVVDTWKDDPEIHTLIYKSFVDSVNADDELREHRHFVKRHQMGYGNKPFHWMWNLIIQDLPQNFKFLEVGVYQGQIISLMSLLNRRHQKNGTIYGLTPLAPVDDAFSKHHHVDYEERIGFLYASHGLDASDLQIIEGLSTETHAIVNAGNEGPYDAVYIDGGHDYPTVVSDILTFGPMVKPGGYLVMDDSANYLKIPDGLIRMDWRGILDVSNAVRDTLESDKNYTELFSVAHNRVWRRNA